MKLAENGRWNCFFHYNFAINTFLLCLISQLVNPPPPFFNRQARYPRFSFLSVTPTHFSFYFRIEYIILFLSHVMFFPPSHITPNIAYLSTQLFNHSRFQFLNRPRPLFVHVYIPLPQEQITQSLLCISTTGSNDLERSDTKLEAPSIPIEYKIFCFTFYAKHYINRFRNDSSSI